MSASYVYEVKVCVDGVHASNHLFHTVHRAVAWAASREKFLFPARKILIIETTQSTVGLHTIVSCLGTNDGVAVSLGYSCALGYVTMCISKKEVL